MIEGLSIGVSEGALVTCSALLGAVAQRIFSGGSKLNDKNDEQHIGFAKAISELRADKAKRDETLRNIEMRLNSIDDKLDRI